MLLLGLAHIWGGGWLGSVFSGAQIISCCMYVELMPYDPMGSWYEGADSHVSAGARSGTSSPGSGTQGRTACFVGGE